MPAWRRAARPIALAASLAVLTATRGARADSCANPALSTCINDENFWPHAGPSHFFAVGATETIEPGHVGFGLVTSYLSRPIILHSPAPGPNGTDIYAINDQINGNFLWSYGVVDRLELDAALPVTFAQGGSGAAPVTGENSATALQDTALRDLRFGLAYALIPRARVDPRAPAEGAPREGNLWALTARFEMSAPTGDRSQFAGERTVVWVPSIAGDLRLGRLFAGAELGARVRPTAEFDGPRVGTQLVTALGVGADVLRRELLAVALEARALPTFAEQHDPEQTPQGIVSTPNGRHIAPAEWTLSLRSAPLGSGDLSLQLGGGGVIPFSSDPAITNPRFRFILGVRYEPLGREPRATGGR